jgi:small-conductance mechanosensitive channel
MATPSKKPAPKKPTYGELANVRTKLEMAEKVAKSRFPNDSVKVTNKMADGKKATLKEIEKQMKKMNPKPRSLKDMAVPVKGLSKATPKATSGMRPTVKAVEKARTAAKATPKAKPKLSKSERDFLAGQKLKAKITKKTGVYPNTAN